MLYFLAKFTTFTIQYKHIYYVVARHCFIMSRRVKKYKHRLKFLSVCEHKSCKQLLGKLVNSICESALNVLHGSIPLQPKNKRKLAKHKNDLRNLSSNVVSIKKNNKIVQTVEVFFLSCWAQSDQSLHH